MMKRLLYSIAVLFVLGASASAQLQIITPAQDSTVSALTRQVVTAQSASGFDAELYVNGTFAQR
jgi:hypothetical protein